MSSSDPKPPPTPDTSRIREQLTEEGLGEVEVEANMRDRGLIITGSVTADPEHAAQARVESLIHAAAPDFTITKFWIERRL